MRFAALLCIFAELLPAQTQVVSYVVSRVAGTPQSRIDGVPASEILFQRPFSLAQDRSGTIYVSDAGGIAAVNTGGAARLISGPIAVNTRSGANTAIVANDPTGDVLIAIGPQL